MHVFAAGEVGWIEMPEGRRRTSLPKRRTEGRGPTLLQTKPIQMQTVPRGHRLSRSGRRRGAARSSAGRSGYRYMCCRHFYFDGSAAAAGIVFEFQPSKRQQEVQRPKQNLRRWKEPRCSDRCSSKQELSCSRSWSWSGLLSSCRIADSFFFQKVV